MSQQQVGDLVDYVAAEMERDPSQNVAEVFARKIFNVFFESSLDPEDMRFFHDLLKSFYIFFYILIKFLKENLNGEEKLLRNRILYGLLADFYEDLNRVQNQVWHTKRAPKPKTKRKK